MCNPALHIGQMWCNVHAVLNLHSQVCLTCNCRSEGAAANTGITELPCGNVWSLGHQAYSWQAFLDGNPVASVLADPINQNEDSTYRDH